MVRGLTEDGKPKSFRYTLADYWVKDYHNLKIAPYRTTLLKLVCPIGEEANITLYASGGGKNVERVGETRESN